MEKRYCLMCGKEMIRSGPFETGVYEFWCDECKINIVITDNKVADEIT